MGATGALHDPADRPDRQRVDSVACPAIGTGNLHDGVRGIPLDVLAAGHYATKTGATSMTGFSLALRSLCFNVGWYAGSVVIALVGSPILLLPRRAVLAWARFWIEF